MMTNINWQFKYPTIAKRYNMNDLNHHQDMGNQNGYNWQRHAHTVPQSHRGGRRLPQTPNVPSTLSKNDRPQFNAIDPRHGIKYVLRYDASWLSNFQINTYCKSRHWLIFWLYFTVFQEHPILKQIHTVSQTYSIVLQVVSHQFSAQQKQTQLTNP